MLIINILLLGIPLHTSIRQYKVYSCEDSMLSINCDSGLIINIVRSNYGRLSTTVCNNNNTVYDTRCINPTTLRDMKTECQGSHSCEIFVNSQQFSDHCPGTPKYLELVYTCHTQADTLTNTPLPLWIRNIKQMKKVTTPKQKQKITTIDEKYSSNQPVTTTLSTTTLSISTTSSLEFIQQHLPTSLLYSQKNEKKTEKFVKNQKSKLFVNLPKESLAEDIVQDETILVAIIVSSVSCFLIIFIGIIIFINREDRTDVESYSTGSSCSNSTYLQNKSDCEKSINYVLGDDGQIYHTIDSPYYRPYYYDYFLQNNQKISGIQNS